MSDEKRGAEAEQLLRHPLLVEAFRKIEERLVSELAQPDCATDRVLWLKHRLTAARQVHTYIKQVAVTGNLDALEEQRKRSLRDKVRGLIA
jgi:hypothetical protein